VTQFLGIVDVSWRGQRIPVEKGAKVKIGGIQNNAVIFGRQVGRAQEFAASEITATTHLARGQRFKDLYAVGEGELQVICDTGQTYVWSDAFLTERPEMTSGEGGKIEMKWMAGEPEELING
jgi:hypothetical protein